MAVNSAWGKVVFLRIWELFWLSLEDCFTSAKQPRAAFSKIIVSLSKSEEREEKKNSTDGLYNLTMFLGIAPKIIHDHRFIMQKNCFLSGSYFLSSELELIWPLGLQFLFNDSTTSREGGERDHCHLY